MICALVRRVPSPLSRSHVYRSLYPQTCHAKAGIQAKAGVQAKDRGQAKARGPGQGRGLGPAAQGPTVPNREGCARLAVEAAYLRRDDNRVARLLRGFHPLGDSPIRLARCRAGDGDRVRLSSVYKVDAAVPCHRELFCSICFRILRAPRHASQAAGGHLQVSSSDVDHPHRQRRGRGDATHAAK